MTPPTPIEDRLRRALSTVAETTEVHPDLDGVVTRAGRRRGRPPWVAPVLVAAVLAALLGGVAVLAGDDGRSQVETVEPGPTGPLRFLPGEPPDGMELAGVETIEPSAPEPDRQLWVYDTPDRQGAQERARVLVALAASEAEALSEVMARVEHPREVSVAGHPATVGRDVLSNGPVVSWSSGAPARHLVLLGTGIDEAALLAAAGSVTTDGPTEVPDGLSLVFEGADPSPRRGGGEAARYGADDGGGPYVAVGVVTWPGFDPWALRWRAVWEPAHEARVVTVRGNPGLLVVQGQTASLSWRDRDGYVGVLNVDGIAPDELLGIAEGLREVSDDEWRRATAPVRGGTATTVAGELDTWEVDGRQVRAHPGDLDGEDVLCFSVNGISTEFCPALSLAREVRWAQAPDDPNLLLGTADAEGAELEVEVELLDGRTFREPLGPEIQEIRVRPWAIVLPEPFSAGSIRILDTSGDVVQGASVGG